MYFSKTIFALKHQNSQAQGGDMLKTTRVNIFLFFFRAFVFILQLIIVNAKHSKQFKVTKTSWRVTKNHNHIRYSNFQLLTVIYILMQMLHHLSIFLKHHNSFNQTFSLPPIEIYRLLQLDTFLSLKKACIVSFDIMDVIYYNVWYI